MTHTHTEPTDGFLDREFASFRQARLRARKAKEEAALEPRRRTEPSATSSSIEAVLESLDPEPPVEDATRAGQRSAEAGAPEPARAGDPPRVQKVPTMSALAIPDPDETRAHARADLPAESCSDPEFEKFRAARATARHSVRPEAGASPGAPRSDKHARPEREERPRAPRADDDVEGSCSDPGFEEFRAARRPESARHRKPEQPVKATEEAAASAVEPLEEPSAPRVDDSCSDPEFEKFRAARQRPDSARHRKPPEPEAAPEPIAAGPAATDARPEDASGATAPEEGDDEGGLFFGTSVRERAKVRARVLDARSDVDVVEPSQPEPAPEPPTPSRGERRRAPPPPLPDRPV